MNNGCGVTGSVMRAMRAETLRPHRLVDLRQTSPVRVTGGGEGGSVATNHGALRGSRLENLVRDRQQFTRALAILIVIAAVTMFVDTARTVDDSSRLPTLYLNLLYGLYASLLAALIISRIVVATRIANAQERGRALVGLMGVAPLYHRGDIAIVVPAFVNDDADELAGSDL